MFLIATFFLLTFRGHRRPVEQVLHIDACGPEHSRSIEIPMIPSGTALPPVDPEMK